MIRGQGVEPPVFYSHPLCSAVLPVVESYPELKLMRSYCGNSRGMAKKSNVGSWKQKDGRCGPPFC
jgi:hypothetical protein